jgi:hypothetical protein
MAAKKILKGSDLTKFLKAIDYDPDVWFEAYDDNRGYPRQTAAVDMQYERTMSGQHRLIIREHKISIK